MIDKLPVSTVGPLELVDFPRLDIKNVPAKIDTGADSSSIWVSDVRLTSDGLSFVLFAPSSEFYTGQEIIVGTYETTKVKNTSGIPEFRYKVRLVVRLQDRNIRAWFTLSNRAGMNYPVLLGRRFLKNRFVVDVSKTNTKQAVTNKKKQILILISRPKDIKSLNKSYQKIFGKEVKIVICGYSDLIFWISSGKVLIKEQVTNQNLTAYDLVYFKSHEKSKEIAGAVAHYLQFNHINFMDTELKSAVSYDKLSSYIRLAQQNINVPSSFCASLEEVRKDLGKLFEKFGKPLVVKDISADRGRNNFLISSKKDLETALSSSQTGETYLVQEYIENDGYYRACVFGRNVWPIVFRHPVLNKNPLKRHLNQPKGSANAVLIDEKAPERRQIQDIAIRAAGVMNRQIAGVDILKDKNSNEAYVLEVNSAPQIRTGAFPEEKLKSLVKFIDNQLNR